MFIQFSSLARYRLLVLVILLSACSKQKIHSGFDSAPRSESALWSMAHPTVKIGNSDVELERSKKKLKNYNKIVLMTAVPNSFCHLYTEHEDGKAFQQVKLQYDGDVGQYFNNIFVQELTKLNIDVELINPLEYFGAKKPFFTKAFKTQNGLRSYPFIKSQHQEKLENLENHNKAALLLLLYVNESTHGKQYQNECFGIRYATKTLPEITANYIHSPTWVVYSLSTGQRLNSIGVDITNGIEMPADIHQLSSEYKARVLEIVEKEFRKEVSRGLLKTDQTP